MSSIVTSRTCMLKSVAQVLDLFRLKTAPNSSPTADYMFISVTVIYLIYRTQAASQSARPGGSGNKPVTKQSHEDPSQ